MIEDRVLIAGAGPVGLVAAAQLVRQGIPVNFFYRITNILRPGQP